MATLVLSTVGTVLGGPAGSAIGALIGQSIDQELLAPARRGPRVGDLNVQTSSYGTQIPRIYGTMRVAGSVIWSTDLVEHEQLGGAKGQPDVAYGYSVSMAVALSSRVAKKVGRIWADGKLLRGAAGDFKVGTKFRFYDGSDDQIIDPLIASIEGIASTPAFRGLAIAVFEDLELGEFGNRIPFLTFEIAGDDQAVPLGDILSDVTRDIVQCESDRLLEGFAAYGNSIENAIAPLVESYGIDLLERNGVLGSARPDVVPVGADEMGCSVGDRAEARLEREQASARSLPASLRVTYYDAARDYQTGEARATAGEVVGADVQRDLPVVMAAGDAKALTQQMLARAWRERETVTLRLPPARLGLAPGDKLQLPDDGSIWTLRKIVIDGFVVAAELQPTGQRAPSAVLADPGRIAVNPDIEAGPVTLALLDIPNPFGPASNQPTLMLAASRKGGWSRQSADVRVGGQSFAVATSRVKSVLGMTSSSLAAGTPELIDRENSVEVQLIDPDQWLVSCDDDALAAGANLAVVGKELLQFGQAIALGSGRFRLGRLLRGRGGTEWTCPGHSAGEVFCLVQASSLTPIGLPLSALGDSVSCTVGAAATSIEFDGQSVRPLAPVNLTAARRTGGELDIRWIRRSRQGFAWLDGLETPVGEAQEQYRVIVTGSAGDFDAIVAQSALTLSAATVASLGPGSTTIQVEQVGDVAVSVPEQLEITLL